MTDNRIDFEDCGAFVCIDEVRIAKRKIEFWQKSGLRIRVRTDAAAITACAYEPGRIDGAFEFEGINADEVLAALDEAMRGAR